MEQKSKFEKRYRTYARVIKIFVLLLAFCFISFELYEIFLK